jgi:hypothetical protein
VQQLQLGLATVAVGSSALRTLQALPSHRRYGILSRWAINGCVLQKWPAVAMASASQHGVNSAAQLVMAHMSALQLEHTTV